MSLIRLRTVSNKVRSSIPVLGPFQNFKIFFCLLLLVCGAIANAESILGSISDAETNEKVLFATAYIHGTTKGTMCDTSGSFNLDDVIFPCKLVISHVNYQTHIVELMNPVDSLTVVLKAKKTEYEKVKVTDIDNRDANLEFFTNQLLGYDEWGEGAKIVNDEVLLFDVQYDNIHDKTTRTHMVVKANEPLKIQLPKLGYVLHLDLSSFDVKTVSNGQYRTSLAGHYYFKSLSSEPSARSKKNRKRAYLHSRQHFLSSLYTDTYRLNGYRLIGKVDSVESDIDINAYIERHGNYMKIIGLKGLRLKVYYYSELNGEPCDVREFNRKGVIYRSFKDPKISKMYFLDDTCYVWKNGYTIGNSILFTGEIAEKRVGATLPGEYVLNASINSTAIEPLKKGESSQNLTSRNKKLINELVYMHTDREVYAPGDTVWFKTYVRNKAFFTKSQLSDVLHVHLLNSKFENIFKTKCVIRESSAIGYIPLSSELEEGNYQINYYTSWMQNFLPGDIGLKQISIKKDIPDAYRLMAVFDRTRYYPGDTVRFKVNCLDKKDAKVKDIKYTCMITNSEQTAQKEKGKTMASDTLVHEFILATTGNKGKFRVSLNATIKGDAYVSNYNIPVCDSFHLGFYPEGGDCFYGGYSSIAFKAVGSDGNPVDITGNIVDEDGAIISENVQSQHNGMGKFMFMPQKNKSYYFDVKAPTAFAGKYALPKGKDKGYLLTAQVNNDSIFASARGHGIQSGNMTLTVMVRGYIACIVSESIQNMKKIEIPCKDMPRGIAVLTLFDSMYNPVAERLIYLPFANPLQARVQTDKKVYDRREKVEMDINIEVAERSRNGHHTAITSNCDAIVLSEPIGGDYSLTIYDDYLGGSALVNNPHMPSSFLVSPEIKGAIHDPDYYLSGNNDTILAHLDLLLLTQGWRKYESIKQNLPDPVNRDIISGILLHHPWARSVKPFPNREVLVSIGGITSRVKTDGNGRFVAMPDYTSSVLPDIKLYAEGINNRMNVSIVLDSILFDKALMAYYDSLKLTHAYHSEQHIFTFHNFTDHFYNYNDKNHVWLDAVEVATAKVIKPRRPSDEIPINTDLTSRLSSGYVYAPEVIESYGLVAYNYELPGYNPEEPPHQKIRSRGNYIPVFYKLNDILYNTSYYDQQKEEFITIPDMGMIENIKVEDIEELVVAKGIAASAIIGTEGILVYISTKPSAYIKESLYNNEIILKGFLHPKQKYNPIYDTKEKKNLAIPDFRKTLYWQPSIKLDENGKAQVSFYTADRFTKAKYILEGITDKGVPVYHEGEFSINE